MIKKIYFFGLLLLLTSCAVRVPLSSDYWNTPSKVGLLVNVTEPSKYRSGSQGLLDLALTSGDKYAPVLAKAKELNPETELIAMYTTLLQEKGKEVVVLDEAYDPKTSKFTGKKEEGKKYAPYDVTSFKTKYNVDEVLLVNVDYGLMIDYYSMVEIGRSGYANYNTQLINATDNSLYLSNSTPQIVPIKGKWNIGPDYTNVISNIKLALAKGQEAEKNQLK